MSRSIDDQISGCKIRSRGHSALIGITARLFVIIVAAVAFFAPQSISAQGQKPLRSVLLFSDVGTMASPRIMALDQAILAALEQSPISWVVDGQVAARMAVRVLSAGKPQNIPIVSDNSVYIFDRRALRHWGLSEKSLLASSTLFHRELSIWQRAKSIGISGLLIILGLSALVAYLQFSRKELRLAKDAQMQLTGRLIDAQEKERSRLAAELHDDFSQRLALLALGLETASEALPDSPLSAKHQLQELMNSASELGADIHTVSHRLHSATLESLGLEPGIRYLCKEFADRHGIEIDFSADKIPRVVDPNVALCLFRIVQEALQNLRKHSGAARAEVRLIKRADRIFVSVYDQGKGFNMHAMKAQEGLGIRSMGERARLLSGRFEVHSKPGGGTRVEAAIPLPTTTGQAHD